MHTLFIILGIAWLAIIAVSWALVGLIKVLELLNPGLDDGTEG